MSTANRPRPEPRVFVEFRPSMRTLIEEAVESLLLLLDELDGDADLEEEPDTEDSFDQERDLGATNALDQETAWRGGRYDANDGTLEFDGEDTESADTEPNLGSLYGTIFVSGSQEHWAGGRNDDREDEHDGAEPDPYDEPSLGWTGVGVGHPLPLELGESIDAESDIAEWGIGDNDGLIEQVGGWGGHTE